jgi:hypothetical protein
VLDPIAIYRDTELLKLRPGWAAVYAWRGNWSSDLPRNGPLAEYFVARLLARIGVAASHAPVVMLLHLADCPLPDADAVDVREPLYRVPPH